MDREEKNVAQVAHVLLKYETLLGKPTAGCWSDKDVGVQAPLMAFIKTGPRPRGHGKARQEHILLARVDILKLMHDSPKPSIRKRPGNIIKGSLKQT